MGDLDELAALCQRYHIALCYTSNGVALAFRYKGLPRRIRLAIRNRRRGLRTLMMAGDHRLCMVPAHKQYYRYIGKGRFQCEMCVELDAWQAGLWQMAG